MGILSVYSSKQIRMAFDHAKRAAKSKGLRWTWEISLILFFWKTFQRKRYVACLLLYISGKYKDSMFPIVYVSKMTESQICNRLILHNWTW